MRKKCLVLNMATSLTCQIVTIICGFILPRLILSHFGSEVNGLLSSITQFLCIISFLEMGVGAVVQSALYQPLADQDNTRISEIVTSAGRFFRKIAGALCVYAAVLIFVFPCISNGVFDRVYTAALILIISISSLVQYGFGFVDTLLLNSAQRGYVCMISQIITTLVNTAVCSLLIFVGAPIHLVKLAAALIFLIRPFTIRLYVNRHYTINRRAHYIGEPITQKWNGVAQHMAAVVLDSTDMLVLTMFSTMTNVSIYSVYYTVVRGVTQLTISLTNGLQALMGELLAKDDRNAIRHLFRWTEWSLHTSSVFIFGCCASLIVPFVRVYTNAITDADYIQPLFGLLLTLANAGHCLRLPYNMMILAGGHYRQTQGNYIVAAILNLVLSVLAVRSRGLIGVAMGTLAAMLYQTIWMAWYVSRHMLPLSLRGFARQLLADVLGFGLAYLLTTRLPLYSVSLTSWAVLAAVTAIIYLLVIALVNVILYRDHMGSLFQTLLGKRRS